jgi:hypothetical protein
MTSILPSRGAFIQRELGLELPVSIPLVPMQVARVLLNLDDDYICEAIELSKIRWAFNIAAPDAERGELRIHRDSLLDACHDKNRFGSNWLRIPSNGVGRRYDHLAELPNILRACLPPGDKPFFPLASLARRWTCSPQHIQNLIDAGCLTALAPARMGPNGSAMITRDSAERFLAARCESLPALKVAPQNIDTNNATRGNHI